MFGCRLMFVAEQLMQAVEAEVQVPRYGRAAQAAARDKKASMLNAIAKANMLDTPRTRSRSILAPTARFEKTPSPRRAIGSAPSSPRCRALPANWKAPRAR